MSNRPAGTQTAETGDGCNGQQNGAHRLGSPYTKRTLQAPRGLKGAKEQQRRKTIEMMEQYQPVSQDTPPNVMDTFCPRRSLGLGQRKPSGPAGKCAA
jgi:hypothetical protein